MSFKSEDFDIIVDTKEPKHIFTDIVNAVTGNPKWLILNPILQNLPCGDLKFRDLGAERKTLTDFIGSINDGRIFKQAYKMSKAYTYPYLLVSGYFNEIENDSKLKGIYTTCADVEFRYGFRIMFFPNDTLLCYYFIGLCIKYSQKLKPIWRFEKNLPSSEDEKLCVIEGIYGIGPKTARLLLNSFKTIDAICEASISDLELVKGIGKKTAKHIFEVLH